MPWSKNKAFDTIDPETGKLISIKPDVDDNGFIKGIMTDLGFDTKDEKNHGHIWGLNDDESKIGSRPSKREENSDQGSDDSSK
jgi:hypothetical protein